MLSNISGTTTIPDSQAETSRSGVTSANITVKDLVRLKLESTWDEYYFSWHTEHCQQTLNSLGRPALSQPIPTYVGSTPLLYNTFDPSFEHFEITDFDDSHTAPKVYLTNAQHEITVSNRVETYSPYDSCTPLSRNLMRGDDPDYLPFIPFSDDRRYDFEYDNSHHKYFSWQRLEIDPDLEEILFETLRTLLLDYGLSYQEVDKTRVLGILTSDIYKLANGRNFSKWKGESPLALLPAPGKTNKTPRETVQYFLDWFCNNLNCLTNPCLTHFKTRTPRPVAPKIDYSKLADVLDKPCGIHCFMQPMSNANTIGTVWTADDVELLFVTLDYAPDTLSCDLAVICRKPCREIHRQRKSYKSPVVPAEKAKQSMYINTKGLREFDMLDAQKRRFSTRLPCQHAGPCDAKAKCACFLTRAPCYNRCGCSKSCPRRWKGCSCAKSAKVCGTKKCSCFRAFIECDPEVCIPCEAKGMSAFSWFANGKAQLMAFEDMSSNLCRNVGIQRGAFKSTQVRQSEWGLGLFITEPCEKRELISEYVGELIYNPTVRSRAGVSTHKGRSYIFDLNRRVSLDSAYAGNGTRYINHSSNANCDTAVVFVNGEHRIGVYAARRLEEGEELFIDYGPKFFQNAPDTQNAS